MTAIDPIIVDQVAALLDGETNVITNLSNAAAILYNSLDQVNWAGFYIYSKQRNSLDLGPFQGQVACMHIAPGSGVVGTSYEKQTPLRVPNVHEFAGHIACDAASNSETVVPLKVNGTIVGIMDIDSPILDRFSEKDVKVLTDFGAALSKHLDAAALSAIY